MKPIVFFFNGSIEKHIPTVIADGKENKYKYEYITKKDYTRPRNL
jgi:hypothetical protein